MWTEEQAQQLLVLCCPTNLKGEYVAEELAQEQTLENLEAFGKRLKEADEKFGISAEKPENLDEYLAEIDARDAANREVNGEKKPCASCGEPTVDVCTFCDEPLCKGWACRYESECDEPICACCKDEEAQNDADWG